jgi:hypothetical protein
MKLIVAGLVCLATLFGVDRALFKGAYFGALKQHASDSAAHYQ